MNCAGARIERRAVQYAARAAPTDNGGIGPPGVPFMSCAPPCSLHGPQAISSHPRANAGDVVNDGSPWRTGFRADVYPVAWIDGGTLGPRMKDVHSLPDLLQNGDARVRKRKKRVTALLFAGLVQPQWSEDIRSVTSLEVYSATSGGGYSESLMHSCGS